MLKRMAFESKAHQLFYLLKPHIIQIIKLWPRLRDKQEVSHCFVKYEDYQADAF